MSGGRGWGHGASQGHRHRVPTSPSHRHLPPLRGSPGGQRHHPARPRLPAHAAPQRHPLRRRTVSALVHPSLCLRVLLRGCAHLCTLGCSCACLFVLVHASGDLFASARLCTRVLACPYFSMLVQSCLCLCSLGLAGVYLYVLVLACANRCVLRHACACPFLHAWAPLVRGGHGHPVFPPPSACPCWCSARPHAPLHVPAPLLFTLCPPRDHIYAFDLGQDKRVLYPERVRGTGAPFLGSPGSWWGSLLPTPVSPAASHLGDAGQRELRHAGQAAGTGHRIWGHGVYEYWV